MFSPLRPSGTNSEYRQFVEWVKDSIIRTRLAILADEQGQKPGGGDGKGGKGGSIGDFAFKDQDPEKCLHMINICMRIITV